MSNIGHLSRAFGAEGHKAVRTEGQFFYLFIPKKIWNGVSVNGAYKNYGIPRKKLARKINNNVSTIGKIGPEMSMIINRL